MLFQLPSVGNVVIVRGDPVLVRLLAVVAPVRDIEQQARLDADGLIPMHDELRDPDQDAVVLAHEKLIHLSVRQSGG